MLRKWDVMVWTEFYWLRTVAGSCEPSRRTEDEKSADELCDYPLLK